MKTLFIILLLWALSGGWAISKELSELQQQELLEHINYIRNQGPQPTALEDIERIKCGTDIALDFFINRQYLTGKYATEAEAFARPTLQTFYDTPGGHFRIHYDSIGSKAVYQAAVDTTPTGGDGIPDYVNIVGRVADSVWNFTVVQLGFPPPASDADSGGGIALVDLYLNALSDQYYGVTWGETAINSQTATSYMELDNDYAGIPPYNGYTDLNDRLDAARVTIAHEFFHTIHYTMDYTEYENQVAVPYAQYWWEISAVWMEEMMYDDINDYYYYLDYYYNEPWKSLQAVTSYIDLHQYAAVVFPIFLTESIDTAVVRVTWEKCRDYGTGPQFPLAVNDAIDSITGGVRDLRSAFQEFAVWNYFTGTRASEAPAGFGFSEAANYSMIPDSNMLTFDDSTEFSVRFLQWVEGGDGWPDTLYRGDDTIPVILNGIPLGYYEDHMPQNLGAHYISVKNLEYLVDTIFNMGLNRPQDPGYGVEWDLSIIQFPSDGISEPLITMYDTFDGATNIANNNNIYNRIMAIPTPVSTEISSYYLKRSGYGYSILFLDTTFREHQDEFMINAPYPNPFGLSTDDETVTFKADIMVLGSGHPGQLEVTIFDIAGNKVKVVASESGTMLNNYTPAITDWDITNENNVRVAPGVYLAFCKLMFTDGTPEITEKYKIAVIR